METKPTAPGGAKLPGKADTPEPTMHVRALVPCYVNGMYYYAGDEFDVAASGFNEQAMERVSEPKRGNG